jgi:hypothetical protein
MIQLDPQKIKEFSSGMITNLNESLYPKNSVALGLNLDFDDEIASAVTRLGSAIVGSVLVADKTVLGLHFDGFSSKLFASINDSSNTNSDIFDVVAGSIVGADDTASLKARFLTYLGETVRLNGTDVPRVYNTIKFVSTQTFTAATDDVITSTAHGLADGDTIQVSNSGGALPTGLAASTTYYVRDRTADTFKVSLTSGGSAVDITGTGSGTQTWSFKGNLDRLNMPTGYKVAIEFLDRVYMLVHATNIDTIVYSGVATSGAVSWTSGNGSVNLEPEDGAGGLVGAGKVPGYILFFKRRSMKRWNFITANPESMVGIGTCSHESIVNTAGICGFFSDSDPDAIGFYITDGTYPVPISHLTAKNIRKWIDAIPSSFRENISGWGSETHMYWSIGDVTVDNIAYTNVVLRWSIKTREWSVRSYPQEFRVFTKYVLSGVSSIVGGTTAGTVVQIDKPETFDDYPSNTEIGWELLTQEEYYTDNRLKNISDKMVVVSRKIQKAEAYIVAGNSKGKKEVVSGPIKGDIAEIKLKETVSGNYFQYGIRGQQKGSRATIKEIELPKIEVTNNYL